MGKVYKRKRRSCGLCKPHKVGGQPRNKAKIAAAIQAFEKEMQKNKKLPRGCAVCRRKTFAQWAGGFIQCMPDSLARQNHPVSAIVTCEKCSQNYLINFFSKTVHFSFSSRSKFTIL